MNWIIFVALTIFFDSIRIFVDNYVSDVYFKGRGAVSQKVFYAFAATFCSIALFFITGFDFLSIPISAILLFILSGVLSSIGSIPYYHVLEIDNSINLGIFFQFAPILYLILDCLFFGATISPFQIIAFFFIISAPILTIITAKKRSRNNRKKAFFFTLLYVLTAVIGSLIFVKANNDSYNFLSCIALMFFGKGFGAILTVCTRSSWRRRFRQVVKSSKRKVYRPLVFNSFFILVKDIAYRSALSFAPSVAIASAASDSIEPVAIFFMGIVLTLIWPKFGREKLDRRSVLNHTISTTLIVIGIILLQF